MKLIYIFFIFLIKYPILDKYLNLYFIRHAQGEHNAAAEKCGFQEYENIKWFDAELTPKGINDSINIQNKIKRLNPDVIYSSPLKRTIQTMYYSTKKINDIPIFIDDRLRETMNEHPCNYRNNKTEIEKWTNNLFHDRFINYENIFNYHENINNNESIYFVITRGVEWLSSVLTSLKNRPYVNNVLIFTHGSFMKYFLNSPLLKKLNTNYKCFDYPNNLEICHIVLFKI